MEKSDLEKFPCRVIFVARPNFGKLIECKAELFFTLRATTSVLVLFLGGRMTVY
jgi:hypothetical protein